MHRRACSWACRWWRSRARWWLRRCGWHGPCRRGGTNWRAWHRKRRAWNRGGTRWRRSAWHGRDRCAWNRVGHIQIHSRQVWGQCWQGSWHQDCKLGTPIGNIIVGSGAGGTGGKGGGGGGAGTGPTPAFGGRVTCNCRGWLPMLAICNIAVAQITFNRLSEIAAGTSTKQMQAH